ncbi:dephospho-CoA kinase [Limibacillus sp. MBR-115]|uniref:dephospho-CoA kinase n=1 Tax=Limibacillus sp. MBR-115 TaxID=3156465 RepID=UPI00339849FC
MVILGLTGSIGMGKSTTATMLRRMGVPVHDADAAVHRLMASGGAAVATIEKAFPGTRGADGGIDRKALGAKVFQDPASLRRLEAILHPMVRAETAAFLRRQARMRHPLVVLDIPLLYETGAETRVDAVLVVTAPDFVQRGRVLKRTEMTQARLDAILAQQVSDHEKQRRADFVLKNGLSKGWALKRLKRIVKFARGLESRHWPPKYGMGME